MDSRKQFKNFLLFLLAEFLVQPGESLRQALSADGRRALAMPGAALDAGELEALDNLLHVHHGDILLVGQDEEDSVFEVLFGEHLVELFAGLVDTVAIGGVDNEDEAFRVLVVVLPHDADLVLPSHVPDVELRVLELDGLDVEADGGDGLDDLAQFQLEEDGGLARGVEAEHQDPHLALLEE